jgi:hypothetical protein
MPAMYDAIKESYLKRGKSEDEAQSIAAATFNKHAKKSGTPFLAHYVAKEKGMKAKHQKAALMH